MKKNSPIYGLFHFLTVAILLFFLFISADTLGEEKLEKESPVISKTTVKHYEFEELLIKIRLQEPDVLFILDRPNVLAEPFEEDLDFMEKIDDPVLKDNLF